MVAHSLPLGTGRCEPPAMRRPGLACFVCCWTLSCGGPSSPASAPAPPPPSATAAAAPTSEASPASPENADGEALQYLGDLVKGSKNNFQMETDTSGKGEGPYVHTFCPSSKTPVPDTLPAAGASVTVPGTAWDQPTWQCLKFAIHGAQRFQYAYETNGKNGVDSAFTAIARRRLTNGKIRVLRLRGKGSLTGDAVAGGVETEDE